MMSSTKEILLVTGSAGFIGMHVTLKAAEKGYKALGIDNLNNYYDVSLKLARLEQQGIASKDISDGKTLWGQQNIGFAKGGIEDRAFIERIFSENDITHVIHLAAQGGVRYSIGNPRLYVESNINGFFNVLESCRAKKVKHLVYASSSSVYGLNTKTPFSTLDNVEHPISMYAATKKSNELMAHTYSHLYGLPTSGLRFFTVYGPWGRPDMAIYKFTERIISGKPIDVYNNGEMSRDFTYISDVVNGVLDVLETVPTTIEKSGSDNHDSGTDAPYRVCNIGRSKPESLGRFIACIEIATGRKAIKNNLPMQPADVHSTYADISRLQRLTGYVPKIDIEEGIANFVSWYRKYHRSA